MNAVSATELARMRDAQEALLPETATIRTRTQTSDGQGGVTDSWTTTATTCRVGPMAPGQNWTPELTVIYADRLAGQSGWVLTLPYDAVVVPGDVIRVGTNDYTVLGVNDDESWQTALRVICARVRA